MMLVGFLSARSGMAIPPNPNYHYCWNRCQQDHTCTTPCDGLLGPTTCGAYSGAPANDLDSDGVANASDNCVCTPNPNQANCDKDSLGDACDATDNSIVQVSQGTQACHIDQGGGTLNKTLKIYYGDVYSSSCTGTCVKKRLVKELSCGTSLSTSCCTSQWFYPDCTNIPWFQDLCGQPRCPF
jgi:hypothetical protein